MVEKENQHSTKQVIPQLLPNTPQEQTVTLLPRKNDLIFICSFTAVVTNLK